MRRLVLKLFWLESALAVVGFLLLGVRVHVQGMRWSQILHPTWGDTLLGGALTLVMLALALAGSLAAERWAAWAFLKRWMLQVAPLFSAIRLREMVMLSVVAGFGEEILFRGVLQPMTGIWLTSALFAAVHVLRWDSDGVKMMLFYLPFGLLLGGLYALTGNLWGSCVAHTLYDLIALRWMQRLAQR